MGALFACGDMVVYGIHGVCSIIDVETRIIDRKKVEYYVLEPKEQPETRYYIPTHNQAALSKLRPILSKQELDKLLSVQATEMNCWIADENQRKQRYRELINSGDRAALISMVRTLHRHKNEQLAAGRKFHLCDENFLRDAEKLLSAEFSMVLNIHPSEVGTYIQKAIDISK